jgi:Glycosyltransferase family 87
MTTQPRNDLRIAAVFCAAIGLYDALYVIFEWSGGPRIGFKTTPLPDFLVFHAAARAFFEGRLALVYDIDAFTRYQLQSFSDLVLPTGRFRPFIYPPIWLLMFLPFGLMAVIKAYALFMTATAAAATWAEGRRDLWGWLAVLVSPAAVWVVLAGQNTFLSIALLYGGLRLLERFPAVAGILLGLLSYKPQIWVLVPLALLAARQWRALAWMIGTVMALALTSLVVFGLEFWLAFLEAAREAQSSGFVDEMFKLMFTQMTTLLAAARMLGLPPEVAIAVQLAGAILAVAAVWQAFRHHGSSNARTAVLVAAMFLISPYTLNYDLLLLMPVAVALFRQAAAQGFYPGERVVLAALWLIPTAGMILNRYGLPVVPLIVLLFGTIAWARLRAESKVELPSPAGAG